MGTQAGGRGEPSGTLIQIGLPWADSSPGGRGEPRGTLTLTLTLTLIPMGPLRCDRYGIVAMGALLWDSYGIAMG